MGLLSSATSLSFFLQYFRTVFSFLSTNMRIWSKYGDLDHGETDRTNDFSICEKIRDEDVRVVLERLRIQYNKDEGFCVERMEEVLGEEITMEEAEEAFRVFDENGDGYIDAMELQRVLSNLGFKKGDEECRRMIEAADENKDSRISFYEFLKLIDTFVLVSLQS